MTVGVFIAWDFLAFIAVTAAYLLCPKMFIEKKSEYVKLFLMFASAYFLIFLIIRNLADSDFANQLFAWCFTPALFVFHQFFPFKTTKKNQHLRFFLFCGAFFCVALWTAIIGLFVLFGDGM